MKPIKVIVKFGDLLDVGAWEDMCKKYGINEWCINEGIANRDDTIEVSLQDAANWGLIKTN